ncbi:MAG: hypothetical protein U0670_07210 [Anaerolineae bacterium]
MKNQEGYYEMRSNLRQFSKYAVALRAVSLLSEGDSLLIDAGTSLTPIAKIIRNMADNEPVRTHYTIMTHNNQAFLALSNTLPEALFNVFQTGGRYDRDLNASFGHQAETAYLGFHPRWVFIGQNGLEADLGLFCHGNTEELALKRAIFARPAWGRVIIADFTKIGTPGGLLFGDSSNLTANVEECMIITDDIHDKKFKSYGDKSKGKSKRFGKRFRERFETQMRSLKETYQTQVEIVHYVVCDVSALDEIKRRNPCETGIFVEEPEEVLAKFQREKPQKSIEKINLAEKQEHPSVAFYKIFLTDSDIEDGADFKPTEALSHVVIKLSIQDRRFDIDVEAVYVPLEDEIGPKLVPNKQ